jgi:hypothetical protein
MFKLLFGERWVLRSIGFRATPPLAMGTSYGKHDFLGTQRLRQDIIPAKIEHLRPEAVVGQSRRNDKGGRPWEDLHGAQDV